MSKTFAESLSESAGSIGLESQVTDMKTVEEPEEQLLSGNDGALVVIIISTYTEGTAPETAKWFCQWLEEAAKDFRFAYDLILQWCLTDFMINFIFLYF